MSEEDGKEEEGGGGADTELKTKTPHVNVGKKAKWRRILNITCLARSHVSRETDMSWI